MDILLDHRIVKVVDEQLNEDLQWQLPEGTFDAEVVECMAMHAMLLVEEG
jgi:hypothetical protein